MNLYQNPGTISGRIHGLRHRLPEIGKIKIGGRGEMRTSRQGTSFQPPQRLTHFRVTKLVRSESQTNNFELNRQVHAHAAIGDHPTSLPIRLIFDDAENNLFSRLQAYKGRSLFCHGNGEQALRIDQEGKWRERPCPCELLDDKRCKPYGRFICLLDVPGIPGIGGVHVLRTTSRQTIENLYTTMDWIARLTGGRLSNIPLQLDLIWRSDEIPNPNGGTMNVTYPVIALQFTGSVDELFGYAAKAIESEAGYRNRLLAIEDRMSTARDLVEADEDDDLEEPAPVTIDVPATEQETEPEPEPKKDAPPKTITVLGKEYERLGAARTALLKEIAGTDDMMSLAPEVSHLSQALRKANRSEMADELEKRFNEAAAAVNKDDGSSEPEDDGPPPPDPDDPGGDPDDEIPELDI